MKYFNLVCLMLSVLTVKSISSVATQSNWSGGIWMGAPQGEWTDRFHGSSSVCTNKNGEITLSGTLQVDLIPLNLSCADDSKWADIDLDGLTDVVCRSASDDSLYWFRNPGIPDEPWPKFLITVKEKIWSFDLAILNGQFTYISVAYVSQDSDLNQVDSFWMNSPATWYGYNIGELESNTNQCSVTSEDIDGNGVLDIAASQHGCGEVVVWWNTSPGTPELIVSLYYPMRPEFHDLDNDGDLEFFIELVQPYTLVLFWNTGPGWVDQHFWEYYMTGYKSVTNFNGGPRNEVVFSMFNELNILWHVAGTGWVQEIITSPSDAYPVLYDINDDDELDIITSYGGTELAFLYNLGMGEAWREGRMFEAIPTLLALAEINGDSDPDVVLYTPNGSSCWFHPEGETFTAEGFLESTWLSPEKDLSWNTISYENSGSAETSVSIQVRSSSDVSSPPEWSPELASGTDITQYCPGTDDYFQYRLNLYSDDPDESPVVTSVSLDWTTALPEESESVLGTVFRPSSSPAESPVLLIQLPVDSSCRIEVFDISGRVISSCGRDVSASVMNHLVVPDLPDGIYHARLRFGENVMNTRFTVLPK